MTTLNDITSNLMDENKSEILDDLYKKINSIEDNMDSDHGKFFVKELKDIVDKSDTKSQKGLKTLNSQLNNVATSISNSNIIKDSEKNTLQSAISGQQEIISDNSTLTSKITNFIKNKAESVADNGFNIDASSITMAITGSPAFGLAAGFIQDKAKDRIKNIVSENKDKKNRLKRIKISEEISKKEFEFLRTQISEQQVKDELNITDEEIQNKANENNQTYEEYLNTLKDSIIQQSQSNKIQNEIDDETKKEEDKIKEKYGMDNSNVTTNNESNDNSNVTSNTTSNTTSNDNSNVTTNNEPNDNSNVTSRELSVVTSNDNSNVTTNREPDVTSNDNSEITSIYPTSNSSTDSSDSSIEESRETNRTQEEQTNQLTEINENLRDVVSLLNDGNDIRSENNDGDGDGDGGIIDTVKDVAGDVLATLGIGGGLLASFFSAYKGFKKGGIKGGIKNVRNLVSGKSSTSGSIIDPGMDVPDKGNKSSKVGNKSSKVANKAKGMINFGKDAGARGAASVGRGAASVGRGAASIGSRVLPVAARAATMIPGAMGSIGTAIASANPIGLAVLGTAALGAGSYALWDHMRGSEESKAALDAAEEAGAVEHNVFGESTVLKGGWEKIKKMKPEVIQALADYDDWDTEAKKGFDEILNPKSKNTKDYKEGKEQEDKAVSDQKKLRSEKSNKDWGDEFGSQVEFENPEDQKEYDRLEKLRTDGNYKKNRAIDSQGQMMMKESTGLMTDDELHDKYDDDGMRGELEIERSEKLRNKIFLENEGIAPSNMDAQWKNERLIDELAVKELEKTETGNIKEKIPHTFRVNGKTVSEEEYKAESDRLFKWELIKEDKEAALQQKQIEWLTKNKKPDAGSWEKDGEYEKSWKLSPDERQRMNNDILKQDALNNEKLKFNDTFKNQPKDNIINAPTSNVNNSKQNITNIIDTSKNSFNSANKGLHGAF